MILYVFLGEGCPRKKKNDGTQIQKSDQRETSNINPSSAVIASFKGKGFAVL